MTRSASKGGNEKKREGLRFERHFTKPGKHPFDEVEWELRDVELSNADGTVKFFQADCEFPKAWSQLASKVVASKYFAGPIGSPARETSLKQLISRVTRTIRQWGSEEGYFASNEDEETYEAELIYLILHQMMAFNSPVWFNLGVANKKGAQISACFINSVEDNMESILELVKTEGMLFKHGSGTGTNLSPLRSESEGLSGGGSSSGPLSFMRGYDAFAGAIKSGGTTRRAAKMVLLNIDHPDVEEFIFCKVKEEQKAQVLIAAGYDSSFEGEAYRSVFFQNSNNSVRVTDEFMEAVVNNGDWQLRAVREPERVVKTLPARQLLKDIAESAYSCGDPGVQYSSTINAWHTCPNTGPINASNPCAEFVFLDDTSCNLASLNLMRFLKADGSFDLLGYRQGIDITITAQEMMVSRAQYPTAKIGKNSENFRPLGLGFGALGALLMACGYAYDSEEGRNLTACLTAIMTGRAYAQSAKIAGVVGPFAGFAKNREPMLTAISKHRQALAKIGPVELSKELLEEAHKAWENAYHLGTLHGYRNAQVTVLAPTGTISFMLDADTTGIEPSLSLVTFKQLVGGGSLKMVNQTVTQALHKLGYSEDDAAEIVAYINSNDTIEGAPHIRPEDLKVFDCALAPAKGGRSIAWLGHVKIMAAAQPFLSGAISKTVNMPNDATVEEIEEAYIEGWRLGLKSLAIYRDGSKHSQPIATSLAQTTGSAGGIGGGVREVVVERPVRRRLPKRVSSIRQKWEFGGHEGYFHVGLYPDGTPGEVFIVYSKEGSTIGGLLDAFATAISFALQHGVPLEALIAKFSHTKFDPQGFTGDPEIPIAKSIPDYLFRWMAKEFLSQETSILLGNQPRLELDDDVPVVETAETKAAISGVAEVLSKIRTSGNGDVCTECGSANLVPSGACMTCRNCGASQGCS